MRKYGLIGFPLSHSFSQRYFTEKFQKENIEDCQYEAYSLPEIGGLSVLLQDPLLCGLNVTIPYKEQVLPFLHELDPVVAQIRACNCISIRGGRLTGYNTDVVGFRQSLQKKLRPHHDRALVLGTGGAAKAVEYTLQQLGIAYQVVSRREGLSEKHLRYEEVDAATMRACTLVINTTPLGMYPKIEEFPPLPYEAMGPAHYLFDLVYNPVKTVFLQKGEERGAAIENGYEMLIRQAEESWRIWNSER